MGNHPSKSAIFETAVVNEILKISSSISSAPNFYHWRTHGGAEVDIILERDGQYYPIEIKMKSKPTKKDCRGIKAFIESYPNLNIKKGLILCTCEESFYITEDVIAFPLIG